MTHFQLVAELLVVPHLRTKSTYFHGRENGVDYVLIVRMLRVVTPVGFNVGALGEHYFVLAAGVGRDEISYVVDVVFVDYEDFALAFFYFG